MWQISPGRSKSIPLKKLPSEEEEVAVLSLEPFGPCPKLAFDDVKVGNISRRQIVIKNGNKPVELKVINDFPEELGVIFNWTTQSIPENTEVLLEITWAPRELFALRHTLKIEAGKIRKNVTIVFKSIQTKTTKAKAKGKPKTVLTKRTRSPIKRNSPRRSPRKALVQNQTQAGIPKINVTRNSPLRSHNKENINFVNDNSALFTSPSNITFDLKNQSNGVCERRETYTVQMNRNIGVQRLEKPEIRENISTDSLELSKEIVSPNVTKPRGILTERGQLLTPSMDEFIQKRLISESFAFSPLNATPRTPLNCLDSPSACSTEEKSRIRDHSKSRLDSRRHSSPLVLGRNITFEFQSNSNQNTPLKQLNISTETYIKGNLSTETYVKENVSSETYVRDPNVSGQTYVKDTSVGCLTNLALSPITTMPVINNSSPIQGPNKFLKPGSPRLLHVSKTTAQRIKSLAGDNAKSVLEANMWGSPPKTVHQLSDIREESFTSRYNSSSDRSLQSSSMRGKRKLDNTSDCSPPKKANKFGITTWSKKCSKEASIKGLDLKKFINSTKNTSLTHSENRRIDNSNAIEEYNPFIWATTSMIDPFMTSMYFGAKWLDEQETRFKKWLNVLLTPPEELQTSDKPLDIAKIWIDCKRKELTLAPTKEQVSSKYHINSKLDVLRKNAMNFYRSNEIATVLSKTMMCVECNRLTIRQDRHLHLDLGLQSEVMAILFSYNTLWLRIGLETIYNEKIPLQSNNDVIGLTYFIANRFFKDPYCFKKHKTVHSPKYADDMRRFILKKMLSLIYFLDKAKTQKLIAHDPCLFSKSAEVKESREALIKFSRDTISASIGDITKYLKHIGYVVTHKQTYINEFDFAINILGADLRDGVRLTRVMEIISLQHGLTNNLRVPAISKLQKIHNMKVVFKALKDAGYEIMHGIEAKDIVEGHKEKTLSFLWQIIYKFQAPLMVKSVTTIQKWWRSLDICLKRKKLMRVRARKENAATKIQVWYRRQTKATKYGTLATILKTHVANIKREKSALKIQSYYKMFKERKHYLQRRKLIIGIQAHARRWLIQNAYRQRIEAAIIIQRNVRKHLARSQFLLLKNAALTIQKYYFSNKLMKIERQKYEVIRYAAIMIQQSFRSYKLTKSLRSDFLKLRSAVIFTQTKFRANKLMKQQREDYLKQRWAAIKIQQYWKNYSIMKTVRQNYLHLKTAVCVTENRYKAQKLMISARNNFRKIRGATLYIQRFYQAFKIGQIERSNFLKIKNSAIVIQHHFVAYLKMKKQRAEYQNLKSAVKLIQDRFRAQKLMTIESTNFKQLKNATIFLQRKFRAKIEKDLAQAKYISIRKAALIIQQRYKAQILMREKRQSYLNLIKWTRYIQSKLRAKKSMQIAQTEYILLRKSAVVIQRRYRAQILMRKERHNYVRQKKAAIFIQRQFRALVTMRLCKNDFNKVQNAAKVIQRWYRATKSMNYEKSYYRSLKHSAIVVQRQFRANMLMQMQRKHYLKLKQSAFVVQQKLRANLKMKNQRFDYLKLREAVAFIQSKYRANKSMIRARTNYANLKKAAIVLQRRYRAKLAMQEQRLSYNKLRQSTLIIQRRLRAQILMQRKRQLYLNLRNSAVLVQRKYRAKRAMILARNNYSQLRVACIALQRRFRANLAMKREIKNYNCLRTAVINLQQRFRANKAMVQARTNYCNLKSAVLFIETIYTARREMLHQRKEYLKLKQCAIFVQEKYRANRVMKRDLCYYRSMQNATVIIQRFWRSYKLMKTENKYYKDLKRNVVFIQQKWRATRQMTIQRTEFIKYKNAVITIQQRYRAHLLMLEDKKSYLELRNKVILVQRKYRANCLMKIQRNSYITLRSTVIQLQQKLRANKLAKICRIKYNAIKSATIKIKEFYRAYKAMQYEQNKYNTLKTAAVTIQRKYRANLQMKETRKAFLNLKTSAIKIQRLFVGRLKMKKLREEFLRKVAAVIIMQKWTRGFLVRKKYGHLLTPEAREEQRIKMIREKATIKIQSYWRGYKIRKDALPKIALIRHRSKEAEKRASPSRTLGQRCDNAIQAIINEGTTLLHVIQALEDLEYITRRCRTTCIRMSYLLSEQLYLMIESTARSLPDMNVCINATQILINFCKYHETSPQSWCPQHLDSLVNVMMHWCDKESAVFPSICTLFWLFAHNKEYKKVILQLPNIQPRFLKIQTLVDRKHKMVSKVGAKRESVFVQNEKFYLPSVKPDWGLDYKIHPKVFTNSVFALQKLLDLLFKKN